MSTVDDLWGLLAEVEDPDADRSITELGMVSDVRMEDGTAFLDLLLPVPNAPSKDELTNAAARAVANHEDVRDVKVRLAAMDDEQRRQFVATVRPELSRETGGEPANPFAQMDSDTKVVAVASGKGGVGKSAITTNVAVALAQQGKRVGILDADIWGYSIPRMMGASGRPLALENLVMPLRAHGCKVISIGFFVDSDRPVTWRGPLLHRALQQFLSDVFWGNLDFLFCDLPPGTGDIAISLAQMLPNADMLVVTTPQQASQKVALRAGQATAQTGMRVSGVVENMAKFVAPDTGKEYNIFGEGGGELLASELETELLGSVPIDPRLREGGDAGVPLVLSDPEAPASRVLLDVAQQIGKQKASVVGKSLPLMG